ncbi:SNAP25 homologous protein SNAP33-like [Iris pallida]|uniref:SNAP25 homologous protein SNAP33-like n=1 Tax=Iris pallida TaxID=29817 RepID=A0AAX6HC12_IRIPA|nr:SNAP25 homologous protein SNAP33-like [Iris pallida]
MILLKGLTIGAEVKTRLNTRQFSSEPTTVLGKVEVEKEKQDDALADLSNLLGQLKDMAVDMGSEIERTR